MQLNDYKTNFNAKSFITLLRYNKDLLQELYNFTIFLDIKKIKYNIAISNSERMYCWYYNITEILFCKYCNKPLKFRSFNKGYYATCGDKECKSKSIIYSNIHNHNQEQMRLHYKETMLSKYGYEHNMQCPELLEQYNISKYKTYNLQLYKKYLKEKQCELIDTQNEQYKIYIIKCNNCGTIYRNISYKDILQCHYQNRLLCKCTEHVGYTVRSKFEQYVYEYILTILPDKIVLSNKGINGNKFIYDIILPEFNFLIECNGIYYHSDQCLKDNNYHYNKLLYANENGYQLLQIWQDDWYNKNDIIKSIIRYYLDIDINHININECTIDNNVSEEEIIQFISENSLYNINQINVDNYICYKYNGLYICIIVDNFIISKIGYKLENIQLDNIKYNLDYPIDIKLSDKLYIEQLYYYLDGHNKIYSKDTLNLSKIYTSGILHIIEK